MVTIEKNFSFRNLLNALFDKRGFKRWALSKNLSQKACKYAFDGIVVSDNRAIFFVFQPWMIILSSKLDKLEYEQDTG